MTKEVQTYSSRATAIRGAQRAGHKIAMVEQREDGRWIITSNNSPLYNAELRVKSEVRNPVKLVWDLCFDNPGAKRRDIVAKAIALGVSLNTARTQYQYWRKAEGLVKSPKLA